MGEASWHVKRFKGTATYLSAQASDTITTHTHTPKYTLTNTRAYCVYVCGSPFDIDKTDKLTVNGGHSHRTLASSVSIGWSQAWGHQIHPGGWWDSSSVKGGAVVSTPWGVFKFQLFFFALKSLAQQIHPTPHFIDRPLVPWLLHLNPFLSPSLSLSLSPSPLCLCIRSTFKDWASCDQSWIDMSASFPLHCIMRLT